MRPQDKQGGSTKGMLSLLNFGRKAPPIAALEWSEGELRLSLPAKGGRMTATFPLTAPPEEQGFEVRRRLQELAQRGHFRAPLCVVIPSYACTYKLLKVAAMNGEVAEGAWRAEVLSRLGLPPEEVELAAAEQPDGLFVIACRKGFLHAYLTPLLQAGLTVRWILPSILGLWAFASDKFFRKLGANRVARQSGGLHRCYHRYRQGRRLAPRFVPPIEWARGR